MKAAGAHVLVEQEEQDKVTAGGIIIPLNTEEQPRTSGKVISIGEKLKDVEFKIGDVIYFDEYGAVPYEVDGVKILAVPYQNIDAYNEQ
jgi:co-chaperonin GroES (HSP10)